MNVTLPANVIDATSRKILHITSKAAYESIKVNGLVPQDRSPFENWKHIKYAKPSAFVFSDVHGQSGINDILCILCNKYITPEDVADGSNGHENWTDERWKAFTDDLVVFEIDLAQCSGVTFTLDPNSYEDDEWMVTHDHIPAGAIGEPKGVAFDFTWEL
jgi:hypothetical protein